MTSFLFTIGYCCFHSIGICGVYFHWAYPIVVKVKLKLAYLLGLLSKVMRRENHVGYRIEEAPKLLIIDAAFIILPV